MHKSYTVLHKSQVRMCSEAFSRRQLMMQMPLGWVCCSSLGKGIALCWWELCCRAGM